MCRPSGTQAIPISAMSSGSLPVITCPMNSIRPLAGFSRPVMVLMVVLGVSLRFIQETKADNAAAKLKAADAAYDKRIAATQGMRLVDKIQAIATARAIRDAAYRVAARLDIEADYERDPANHPQNQR